MKRGKAKLPKPLRISNGKQEPDEGIVEGDAQDDIEWKGNRQGRGEVERGTGRRQGDPYGCRGGVWIYGAAS
ncbi:MAG: hypothetical protein RL693_1734 [Verrucomicrobiota bacterium]